ncbi:hypothetical protein CEXT_204961 [Caerostris extrusa]|uniref:Uncharacterized protein n=1 Tax=Caerostris extrusa TaxID=172846 RepID=A0AAV4NEA7_CAEEX|nr:hypothetical protein CEXT_204961 [Caerostris extrusa]
MFYSSFTCDIFETYPSKKTPFFAKEQLIYVTRATWRQARCVYERSLILKIRQRCQINRFFYQEYHSFDS